MGTGGWGSGGWGSGSWGGGIGAVPSVPGQVISARENVLRVRFSTTVFYTGLLEQQDASRIEKWTVVADASTTGLTGDSARPVTAIMVVVPTEADGIPTADVGKILDIILDRPMTPFPAAYSLAWAGIWSSDLGSSTSGSGVAPATYREVAPPTIDQPRPSQDLANPQTREAAATSLPRPNAANTLGTFGVADDGDYALDQGVTSMKKRIVRRLFTRKNGFAHLVGYGVDVPSYAKMLASPSAISTLRADAEAQVGQEPDVQKVTVQVVVSPSVPDLARLRIAVRPRAGQPFAFETAIPVAT